MFIILVILFQDSIIPAFTSSIFFSQNHHTDISKAYTYDEVESAVHVEVDHTAGLSRVLSAKEIRPDYEVLAAMEYIKSFSEKYPRILLVPLANIYLFSVYCLKFT